ncbi:PepSY-like domain-containing protein [Massilibacteroides sp.]|uniref:PepSY-like domain-containing protein n=1 Tax=Massilibacteroides sp. TaxID=2034766 RepID=UPI00260C76BC|nr:PepSY-like domain-containing protein [Massilibacteroides sp.]MDD4514550.1 PepSY-like domain-containing protein [Massilibacteroides sp.]
MKAKLFMLLFAFSAIVLVSCSDDDDYMPDQIIVNALEKKYPDAQKISWEKKQEYKVAEFIQNSKEKEAWFNASGEWMMTETDILFAELPELIRNHFATTKYATWRVDDVDMIERYNTATIYIIEVEEGKNEVDLYYTEDGVLIKEVVENNGQPHYPLVITESIDKFIAEKYEGAKILEYDKEKLGIEVDILHEGVYKDVYFTVEGEWTRTEWDVRRGDVPSVVLNAIKAEYPGYEIDDIELHETPDGLFYAFELEKGEQEIEVLVSISGSIVKQ